MDATGNRETSGQDEGEGRVCDEFSRASLHSSFEQFEE